MTDQRTAALQELAAKIGHRFADLSLLDLSLTHPSYANENKKMTDDNQRMEFLGDSVLGLVVSEYLFLNNSADEGDLTNAKIKLVQAGTLTERGHFLELGSYLLLGKGEEQSGGRQKPAILEDAIEAVLGAVFLDGGYEAAKAVIVIIFGNLLTDFSADHLTIRDFKSHLQEMVQSQKLPTPKYQTLSEEGPAHDPSFTSALIIDEKQICTGSGGSKKAAEQEAARKAIAIMEKPQ